MNQPFRCLRLLVVGSVLVLWLASGALAAPSYEALMTYTPASSPVRFDTPVSVLIEHVISPEVQAVWLKSLSKAELENYRQAVGKVIFNDLKRSDIFPNCRHETGLSRGFLGVTFESSALNPAERKNPTGVVISALTPDGPAAKAQLRVKDVIVALNGKPVENFEMLRAITAQTPPGTTVKVRYRRDGQTAEADVLLTDAAEAIAEGFLVRVRSEEILTTECELRITLTVTYRADHQVLSGRVAQIPTGKRPVMTLTKRSKVRVSIASALSAVMASLKTAMVQDLQAWVQKLQHQAIEREITAFQHTALPDLLVASDRTVELARARNRAIIAAKNQQLPAILRRSKTDEISALVTRIEQTILDLNHESEVAKDKAQQATAVNGDAQPIEELRGLTISYRERIELLKPIAAAVKEEIANRNR